MIELLVWLLVALIVFAVVVYVLRIIPLPADLQWIRQVIIVVVAAIFLIWILYALVGAGPPVRLGR